MWRNTGRVDRGRPQGRLLCVIRSVNCDSQIHRFTQNCGFTDSPPLRSVDYCCAILTQKCGLIHIILYTRGAQPKVPTKQPIRILTLSYDNVNSRKRGDTARSKAWVVGVGGLWSGQVLDGSEYEVGCLRDIEGRSASQSGHIVERCRG